MGADSEGVEYRVGEALRARAATLATAESCTGGLVAHRVTNVSGASAYYLGGVVSYSNEAKQALLGVDEATLKAHGAVSEAVAREMAEGARRGFDADYAVAVTGIAGPSGGTEEKPVGLVYIAVAGPGRTRVERNLFSGARDEIKARTSERALRMLLEELE